MTETTPTATPESNKPEQAIEPSETVARAQIISLRCGFCKNFFHMLKAETLQKFNCPHCFGILELPQELKVKIRKELNLQ